MDKKIEVKPQREYYYDILRIIACFLVIINHSETKVFTDVGISVTWFVSAFKFLLSKIAVPIFFMISGALLLKKDDSYKKILLRIIRMIVVLLIFSVVIPIILSRNIPSLKGILSSILVIIKRPYFTAYWYLYALIGLYIMTPIIRKMIKSMERKDVIYYFVIWALYTGLLPFIKMYTGVEITSYFNIAIFNVYIGYYMLGYYLININLEKIKSIKIWQYILLILIPIAINLVLCYIGDSENGTAVLNLDGYQFITVMLSSASLFLFTRRVCEKVIIKNNILDKCITEIGKSTFGIYLIHVFLIDKTNSLMYYNLKNIGINYEISVLLQQISVFLVAAIVICIVRKIPIINKII